ncbi:MAG: dihydrodipicolinate synthase family protein, partial [Chloroflexi bacterium]|nr:dihydrodipicolinate synthase family protein [Chloroflexota bacterium]
MRSCARQRPSAWSGPGLRGRGRRAAERADYCCGGGEGVRLSGIVAATVLPMRDDGSIDEPALRRYVGWLLEQGVHGLAVNVDTGEGPHLYPEERTRVVEVVRQEVRGRVPIVAGLPASFTQQAAAWAREAGRAGADAVLVFPHPAFRGRPLPPGIPVRYHRAVAAAAGVPLVVFQLQDALGGVEYPPEVL